MLSNDPTVPDLPCRTLRLLLLGPIELWGAHGQVPLGGPKEKALLAMLALSPNRSVPEGRLIDGIWNEDPPRTAGKVVQNLVLRLRKTLALAGGTGLAIQTRSGGYMLTTTRDALDLSLLELLTHRAREAGGTGESDRAAELLGQALSLWRGEALDEFSGFQFAQPHAVHLSELRRDLLEERLQHRLECGEHHACMAELEALTASHPLRERLWQLRMLALYRCGRQSEALQAYQQVRQLLSEELGLEPSPGLVAMESAILDQDPSLDWVGRPLPSGTVTFLASHRSDARRRLSELGSQYRDLLRAYHTTMREALHGRNGMEVKADSESFLACFAEPVDALEAALSAQATLRTHPFFSSYGVRIGLHRGEANPSGGSYVCLAVHQAERLASAAHGGQTLVSRACADAAARRLPTAGRLVDLGTHQLRDFPGPESVFQLTRAGITDSFPPLRTPALLAHNLPRPRTSFIGRSEERSVVLRLLQGPGVVTVVGPGGVGKTRLGLEVAFEAAERYRDGVWLVELAALGEPQLVPGAVAQVFGLREEPARPSIDVVAQALRDKQALVILDNCEHVLLAAAHLVETLAQACPGIDILATSREPLRVDGEAVWRLAPLRTPAPNGSAQPEAVIRYDAVRLFVERAALAAPGFTLDAGNAAALATIARGLDGMPLALELAAGRVAELSVEEIAHGLQDRFALMSRGRRTALPRQQTMEVAIAWSYALLDDDEQRLFRRLAIFAGSFGVRAVGAVCGWDDLAGPAATLEILATKSLISRDAGEQEPRYTMLETVRDYAALRLHEAAEHAASRSRHFAWFLSFVECAYGELEGPGEDEWLGALERDHDNVREAVRGALSDGSPERALALATKMAPFWDIRGHVAEGVAWIDEALSRLPDGCTLLRGEGLLATAYLLAQSDTRGSRARSMEAIALLRDLGHDKSLGRALIQLAYDDYAAGSTEAPRARLEQALVLLRRVDDRAGVALALGRRADVARSEGDIDGAKALLTESIELHRAVGNLREVAWAMGSLGLILERLGNLAGADAMFQQSGALHRQLRHPQGEAWTACARAGVALVRGDLAAARAGFEQGLATDQELGYAFDSQWPIVGLGLVALVEGDLVSSRRWFERALTLQLRQSDSGDGMGAPFHHLGVLAVHEGRHDLGVLLLAASAARLRSAYDRLSLSDHARREQALGEARANLGPDAFAAAWREGSAMATSQVVAIALEARSPAVAV
ncbi:MAG: hypothetical protein NVSMB32_10140 [Actinomycetota bacterium]